jgi:hypothetical protein
MYDNGQGVPQDYVEAVRWYRIPAENGMADAEYNLGLMFANAKGVAQDYKEAARRFRRAAEHRNLPDAEYNLGVL